MDDVTKFNVESFKESLKSSQEGVDDVEVQSVGYEVNVQYDLPEDLTSANVRETVAKSQGVTSDKVNASKVTAVRRLTGLGRRLAATWDVTIKTEDASAVDAIATKATDVEALQAAAQEIGLSDVVAQVAKAPEKKVAVQFKVKSKPNAAAVQEVDSSKLSESLEEKLGVTIEVAPVEFTGVEEEIKSPPIIAEPDDLEEDGAKTLSCFVAFQMALLGVMAGVQL